MTKPLKGQRILITRQEQQAEPLAELVESFGGIACIAPLLRFEPIVTKDLDLKFLQLEQNTDWLFFTSSNTVRFFEVYKRKIGIAIQQKIASVGEKTSAALHSVGYKVDFEPSEYRGYTMVNEFISKYGKNQKVTIICGENAREEIPELLRENGVSFDKLVIYRTIENEQAEQVLQQYLANGLDACTFTSPSTVKAFLRFAAPEQIDKVKKETVCAAIGKTTADELSSHEFKHVVYPEKYTIEAMISSLIEHKKGW
ncbi:uroporphyrinogen-III synthase [Gracilibacillus ureilyticus]|uniref:Uroporphyrinogen-III synthase n=1 Tax=Gracilibacillus ureilyticus TaxID=531814 RepID=A0A1H9RR74_9BACI|nr:uroporphyrinogen-III synthase [Gracilibacillus ureilyticus]SER75084.1 uroporphyrinogen-III synthase [Gracilibacillus ureilyticus]